MGRARRLSLEAQLEGEVGEILGDDVMVRVRVWVRWPGGAPFIGAAHEGGFESDRPGRVQVEIVAGHNQDFAGLERQPLCRLLISTGQDFIWG